MEDGSARYNILIPMRYPVGGIRTYIKYTHGRMDKSLYSFTLLGPSSMWLERIAQDLKEFEVKIRVIRNANSNIYLFWNVLTELSKKSYDLIHSQGYTAGILTAIANLAFNTPHIVTLHRIFGPGQSAQQFWDRFRILKQRSIELILRRIDVINCVSYDAKKNFLQYFPGAGLERRKLRVIPNGVYVDKFLIDESRLGSSIPKLEKDEFVIGFFGRYMPEKGFPYLIDAIYKLVKEYFLDGIKVLCVGGFGGFVREYMKEIKKIGLSDNFRFLEFFENIAPVLRSVSVLVIPSLGEACGLIGMEGLICGTPTVAFSCVGLREILSNTPARMVPVGDTSGLAHEISRIYTNYEEEKSRFLEFVPEAKKRFDSKAAAKRLDSLYKELISGSFFPAKS